MEVIWSILVVALLGETLLYFVAPTAYAAAARIPFGAKRRLVLHPRALEALRAPPREGAGYRVSAAGEIDLRRLALPGRLELDGLVLHFHLERGIALARFTWSFGRKAYSFLRVDVVATHDAIELRPRFIAMGWPSLIGLAPFGAVAVMTSSRAADWPAAFGFGALFVGLNVALGFLLGRPRLQVGLDEIHRQIQAALVSAESGG